jgi:hypothetical protein
MLHDRDARTLARLCALQRPMLLAGALLFLLGAGYMLWSVDRLHSAPAAAEPDAFDRPIAGLARLVGAAQDRLTRVQPVTPLETSRCSRTCARGPTSPVDCYSSCRACGSARSWRRPGWCCWRRPSPSARSSASSAASEFDVHIS